MAAIELAIKSGMVPTQSLPGEDHVSAHTSISPSTGRNIPTVTHLGPKITRSHSHSNSSDSAIEMGGDVDPLQDKLFSALISTYQEGRGFFAKDQLSEILTEDRVRDELASCFEDSIPEAAITKHAATICHGTKNGASDCRESPKTKAFTKLLAILIMIGKTETIIKLLEEDVNDSCLPLTKAPRSNDARLFDLRLNREPNVALRPFEDWNQLNVRNFEEWQWTTLPVDFVRSTEDGEVKHYKLQEQHILPFIKDSGDHEPQLSRGIELEGGFASVFQVAIHPQHHNFHSSSRSSPQLFAVKRLHSQNAAAFTREVEILTKLSGNKHPHLISLLATYEQHGRFFLVFDWAEADLHGYWKNVNPFPQFDLDTVVWMARQCKGIANGVIKIHAHVTIHGRKDSNRVANQNVVFGHHGDIKPQNVLWFANSSGMKCETGGTLKLSDFGLAEFSIHQTISMPPKKKLGVSVAYRAPEADLQQDKAMGRSYDIWTLGCLYLEFITWMLGGSKLLDEFLEARRDRDTMWHETETHTFFKLAIDNKTNKPAAFIKPAVTQFIKKLHSQQKCSQFIHDFLDMIEQKILVVKTDDPKRMDRFDIKQVHSGLAAISKRCENNSSYMITPVPWKSGC